MRDPGQSCELLQPTVVAAVTADVKSEPLHSDVNRHRLDFECVLRKRWMNRKDEAVADLPPILLRLQVS